MNVSFSNYLTNYDTKFLKSKRIKLRNVLPYNNSRYIIILHVFYVVYCETFNNTTLNLLFNITHDDDEDLTHKHCVLLSLCLYKTSIFNSPLVCFVFPHVPVYIVVAECAAIRANRARATAGWPDAGPALSRLRPTSTPLWPRCNALRPPLRCCHRPTSTAAADAATPTLPPRTTTRWATRPTCSPPSRCPTSRRSRRWSAVCSLGPDRRI